MRFQPSATHECGDLRPAQPANESQVNHESTAQRRTAATWARQAPTAFATSWRSSAQRSAVCSARISRARAGSSAGSAVRGHRRSVTRRAESSTRLSAAPYMTSRNRRPAMTVPAWSPLRLAMVRSTRCSLPTCTPLIRCAASAAARQSRASRTPRASWISPCPGRWTVTPRRRSPSRRFSAISRLNASRTGVRLTPNR